MKKLTFNAIDPKALEAYKAAVYNLISEDVVDMTPDWIWIAGSCENLAVAQDLINQARLHAQQIIARRERKARRNAQKAHEGTRSYNFFGTARL